MKALICDGCRKVADTDAARPADWRRLHVTDQSGRPWGFDICSPPCAAKVVDSTYAEADKAEALRILR